MRVLDLPRRRYSVPETIMRKYRLRQRVGSGEERGRRRADKSVQTSPRESIGRTSSLPFLATPSPCPWSYTASDCQTASDRTTSTQDSTLSVPSSEPPTSSRIVQPLASLPERKDRTTSITGLETTNSEVIPEVPFSIETNLSGGTVVEEKRIRGIEDTKREGRISIACQTANLGIFKVPDISVFKGSSDSQSEEKPFQIRNGVPQVVTKDISNDIHPLGYHVKSVPAEVACAGSNYEDYPIKNPVIPRYSAIPRTNSMLVNTSSVDYSSDSELSLTDSLEDPEEYRTDRLRKQTKHDNRMVRGEVSMEQERRRLPKSRDAYAYFLSLTGEEEIIREYSIPEWLRIRLRKREQEIKKEYEDKLTRHQQCAFYRRRKKTIKRIRHINSNSSGEKTSKNNNLISTHAKNDRTVHFMECANNNNNVNKNNLNTGASNKSPAIQVVNGNNLGIEPKIDNIRRSNHNNNHNCNGHNGNNIRNNQSRGETSQQFIEAERVNKSDPNPNVVQISEVIKIEMSDNKRTIITKEKQINVATEMKLKESGSETIKNEVTNSMQSTVTKSMKNEYTAEITDANTLKSSREIYTTKAQTSEKVDQHPLDQVLESNTEENISKHTESSKCDSISVKEGSTETKEKERISKIEIEKNIADILITALEENTRARQMPMRTQGVPASDTKLDEERSNKYVDQASQKNEHEEEIKTKETQRTHSIAIQTEEILETKNVEIETSKKSEISCNTEPYLVSVYVQTLDKDTKEQELSDSTPYNSECEVSEFEKDENFDESISSTDLLLEESKTKMLDKACNTVESRSISTQTSESILQSDDIVNKFKREKTEKKKDIQFPPQVIRQIITGTGEYKTVDLKSEGKSREGSRGRNSSSKRGKVNKGTNTEDTDTVIENNKNIINSNSEVSKRTSTTPFCKNVFSKTHQKKSEVLELNVPTCSCHMCTLQKISPRGDIVRSKIPQSKKGSESTEEKKTAQKFTARRGNTAGAKFRMFEAIPEEKNSSTESVTDDNRMEIVEIRDSKTEICKKQEKGVLTEPHGVDQTVQVGSRNVEASTNTDPAQVAEGTQTQEPTKRKSNLVIGRFRPENRDKDSPALVRQYKGRASLSAADQEGKEELLTLSKGWINFYLLKDNLDLSDSNGEEAGAISQGHITARRRIQTVQKEEDKVEQYMVEIHAAPEVPQSKTCGSRVTLPEIQSSSSSSEGEKRKPQRLGVEQLPGVRRRTRRSINMTREAVTQDHLSATRGMEVARSEQSISSITSSTLILSESPPPQQLKLPERRPHHRHRSHRTPSQHVNNGSNWTVTVAGSSGSGNDPPPDVEMKLTFGKQGKKQEEGMLQYQMAKTKRQDQTIEEFAHMTRDEKHTQLQCTVQTHHHPKSSVERTRGGTAKDIFSYEEDYINRLSSRSRYTTEDGSEMTGELQVTGLAITPEKKPRVPTQSERDILRPQRYKFTR